MPGDYLRRLIGENAIARIGADGFGLLAWIATQPQPVAVSRGDLARRCGLSKGKVINAVRESVAAGWLVSTPGAGRTPETLAAVGLVAVESRTTTVVSVGASSGDTIPIAAPLAAPVVAVPAPVVEPVADPAPVPDTCRPAKRQRKAPATSAPASALALETIPPELDTVEFREAWGRWLAYRKEKRATVTPTTAAAQLKRFAKHGLPASLWSIEQSIANGWQGLFPENFNTQGTGNGRTTNTATGRVGPGQRFKG